MDSAVPQHRLNAEPWTAAATFFVAYAGLNLLWGHIHAVADAILTLLPLTAAAAFAMSYQASRVTSGKEHRMWRMMTLSCAAFFLAMTARTLLVLRFGDYPGPGSLDDLFFVLGFIALVPVALLITESREVSGARRLRNFIDFAMMVLATLVCVYLLRAVPFAAMSSLNTPAEDVDTLGYTIVTVSFVLYAVAFKRDRWLIWESTVLGAGAITALGVILMAALMPRDLYHIGSVGAAFVDAAWGTGLVLIGVSAIIRLKHPARIHRPPVPVYDLPHTPGVVTTIVALVGVPFLIFLSPQLDHPMQRLLVSGVASTIAVLSVIRGAIVSIENRTLAQLVPVDPLTGLGNVRSLRQTIAAQASKKGQHREMTLAVIDIDGFDEVNINMGYGTGDALLRRLAEELRYLEDEDISGYRLGSDDFALLFVGSSAVEAYEQVMRVSDALSTRSRLGLPVVTLSIGIASHPLHVRDAEELLRLAEGTCYHALAMGGDQIIIYDPQVIDVMSPQQHIAKLEQRTHTTMVESLAAAVDARDPYTQYHSRNVARLVTFMCQELGMPEDKIALLQSAALLHDVGKIGVPDSVLKKEGSLDEEERRLIQMHPDLGVDILHASVRKEILPWVHAHHERPDGKGYPLGLAGSEIPFEARLLAVCDAFDAMTTDRPYRQGLSVEAAMEEMRHVSGTQLDADLVEVLVVLISAGRATDVVLEPKHPRLSISA